MSAHESYAMTTEWEALKLIPPPLAVRPELTADDVAWLNGQLALTDRPPVRYSRELPLPPPSAELRLPSERIR
jgi:hypothetical protein